MTCTQPCVAIDKSVTDSLNHNLGGGDPGGNGERLVITCEGNAGFYEAGMVNVPLGAGYSVIGWNHPGFWEAAQ